MVEQGDSLPAQEGYSGLIILVRELLREEISGLRADMTAMISEEIGALRTDMTAKLAELESKFDEKINDFGDRNEDLRDELVRYARRIGERVSESEIRSRARAANEGFEAAPFSSTPRISIHSASSPRNSAKTRGVF